MPVRSCFTIHRFSYPKHQMRIVDHFWRDNKQIFNHQCYCLVTNRPMATSRLQLFFAQGVDDVLDVIGALNSSGTVVENYEPSAV